MRNLLSLHTDMVRLEQEVEYECRPGLSLGVYCLGSPSP